MRLPARGGVLAMLSVTAGATVLGFSLGGMSDVDRRLQAATTTSTATPTLASQAISAAAALESDGDGPGHSGHGHRGASDAVRLRGLGDHGRRDL